MIENGYLRSFVEEGFDSGGYAYSNWYLVLSSQDKHETLLY